MADAPDSARGARRVAVVFQGDPTDREAWSGVPFGVSAGLADAGAEPVPIDARMPGGPQLARALRMEWFSETTNPFFATGGGLRADAAIRSAKGIDAALVIGSGFSLRTRVPTATFDDMTVAQALAQPDSEYEALGRRQARRWRARQHRNYRRAAACFAVSEWAAASIREDYGVDPAKIHVVGLGSNSPRRALERDWSTPRFLFVGVDWERKRGQAVLDAFALVRERHPEATLDLIGGHPLVDAPGVSSHGFLSLDSARGRDRHAEILARATCLVLPSKFEPFGIAYVDAAAAGVPSIGTTSGGARDAIGDGGLLVDPRHLQDLSQAMLEMCDPATACNFGRRAFAHSAGLSWQGVAERILSALPLD